MKTAERSPMPNQRMASGTQASGGIGRDQLDEGVDERAQPRRAADQQPERDRDGQRGADAARDPAQAGGAVPEQAAARRQPAGEQLGEAAEHVRRGRQPVLGDDPRGAERLPEPRGGDHGQQLQEAAAAPPAAHPRPPATASRVVRAGCP